MNAEFNFKAARYGTQYHNASTAEPMDLSYAEDEAELHAAEQQRNIRRCYMCGSTKHLRPSCPLRKQRQPRSSQVPAPGRKSDAAGETSIPSRCGVTYWDILSSEEPLGGRGEQGLAPDLVGKTTKREYNPGLLVVLATVKGFEKPWSILIDSEASSNYV